MFEIPEILTNIFAFGGFALGCYNTWLNRKASKITLEVIPTLQILSEKGWETLLCGKLSKILDSDLDEFCTKGIFGISIINKSTFPLYIEEIGFTRDKQLNMRAEMTSCVIISGRSEGKEIKSIINDFNIISFPFALHPRDSVAIAFLQFFNGDAYKALGKTQFYNIYARTACHHVSCTPCKKLIETRLKYEQQTPIETIYPNLSPSGLDKHINRLKNEICNNCKRDGSV